MKCLTPEEISDWIRNNGQIKDPYTGHAEPVFRVQCTAPAYYFAIECFLNVLFDQVITGGDLLVQATDWEPTQDCRDFVFQALRHEIGENRPVADAPGFLATPAERQRAVALFAVMTCFKWKCYAYGSHDQITLYNWEGDIFDFWTDSEAKRDLFREIMGNFKLEEIEGEPAAEGAK